ncbi:phenylacetic acid degradation operon negative regulatory protein PaaX [Kineobactrum salinum]|uniref:Phenylacetic acid degradation operon negative regulatory protein PaaX n=1 Tax=Kineobactrum salinum TaxID=2708301 RepID=A0A6C0U413_9GAMM|nr:phenylacetic acid degradation operon negative regulatory protein PaaX [Kineobactrum salinum]QIB66776.1 phenylacetic acid degradation operon negative regulatory protein PaaX [Kineobactrum salinum]
MSKPAALRRLLTRFLARKPMRSTSLIITLFGDVVSQHGHTIWLGSLVQALAPLGVNERLVRTSVFRLVKEGWLEAERVGRRSYYRFSTHGNAEYERAARRIYATEDTSWEGHWQILVPLAIPDRDREDFRRSLGWQGFRNIANGTFAKPGAGGRALRETLEEFDASDKVMVFDATSSRLASPQLLRKMVHECWQLEQTAAAYRAFLGDFKPLYKWLQQEQTLTPETAFIIRTLLIHDYRRVLLHDTPLPEELLPPGWPGAEAQALTGAMYKTLAQPSMHHITSTLKAGNGPMPAAGKGFAARFPGFGPIPTSGT